MQIIVGSTALKHFDLNRRDPKDVDIWTDEKNINKAHDVCELTTDIIELVHCEMNDMREWIATPNSVYTMKMSHLQWDIHWQKTKLDILWLESKGCQIIPDLYHVLVAQWKVEYHDKSFLSFKKNKDEFFNDHVKYVIDHDVMHELVAFPNKPLYNTILPDNEDILNSKDMFDTLLSYEQQVQLFREEITVIAIERWMMHSNKISWFEAYSLSLKKTITNLTKNWASDFIIMNLKDFNKPDYSKFKHALEVLNNQGYIMSKTIDITPFEELQASINRSTLAYVEDINHLVFEMAEDDLWGEDREIASKLGYRHIEQEGGGEGGSEHCTAVFALGDKFYQCEYSYASHNGHEFDDIVNTLKEVFPTTKTITVYE